MEKFNHMNIRELLLGRATRLRYVVRFSICPRMHEETVAEHSYYTTLIAACIAQDLRRNGLVVDVADVTMKALFHDMDETYSGDMIRMFKHSSPELKESIDSAAFKCMLQFSNEMVGCEDIAHIWRHAKEKTLEGAIVSLSDFLSVVSYVVQEIESGNHVMYEHLEDLQKFYETFHKPEYNPLREYIDQAGRILFGIRSRRIQVS